MTHIRYERVLMRFCERCQLNPSRWIPRWSQPHKPINLAGVYTVAYPMFSGDKRAGSGLDYSQPSYHPSTNFYETMSAWTYSRRIGKGKNGLGGWHEFWSFLFEVSIGVYDTTSWGPRQQPAKEKTS